MGARENVLITAAELAEVIRAGDPVTILDVRWRLDQPDGEQEYLKGHIPGAVYVSLEDDLTDSSVTGRGGHPLPSGQHVQAAARQWGVRQHGLIVAYDDWNRIGSGRAWWVLTAAGIDDVRILDGGLGAWKALGGPLEIGRITPDRGNVTVQHHNLYAGQRPTVTADQAAAVTLLDARPAERFSGAGEPMDAEAGHIPGAKSLPCTTLLADDGTFLDGEALNRLFDDRGVTDADSVGVYCRSGVSATVTLAALAVTGRSAALYPGSWSEWSADPSRPVERGSA